MPTIAHAIMSSTRVNPFFTFVPLKMPDESSA